MASVEHCLYCFEVLSAELERREPMTLYQIQQSWNAYPKGDDDSEAEVEDEPSYSSSSDGNPAPKKKQKQAPALERLAANNHSDSSTSTLPSASSTPVSASASTPASSLNSSTDSGFTPPGIGRRTSQRNLDLNTTSPLFVTWNTVSSSSHRSLRGCIGTFSAEPIASGLRTYALHASLHDTRFSPISLRELPSLEVCVTLLTDFEDCADPMDWELGVHGLRISFYHHHKRFGSTYLPDVAVEQGWTKEETLVSLMRKAGWMGRQEKWREVGELKVVRYQGKAESVEWEEYKKWKNWVDGQKK